jgi:hypothetical protein
MTEKMACEQDCQIVCFQTKNPNLGKFCRVLQWKMMVYFMDTFTVFCYILSTFGTVRGNLVYFSSLGILYQNKSGNPVCVQKRVRPTLKK